MTPDFTCAACRARLPEYMNGRLTPDERAAFERHLATCAACRAEAQTWRIIAGVVRGTEATPAPAVPLAASLAQVRARLTPRDQVATSKGSTHMPDTRTTAPATSPRPLRRSYPIIAALLLFALIGVSWLLQVRSIASKPPPNTACDATHSGAGLTKFNSISAIDMISATTGWAVGFTEDPAHPTEPHSLILRYQQCHWMAFGNATVDDALVTLSMGSDIDGWAAGLHLPPGSMPSNVTSYLLHYMQGQWQRVALPAPLPAMSEILQIHMISPAEGWLIANSLQPGHHDYYLFHYLHGTWQLAIHTTTRQFIQLAAAAAGDCLILEGLPGQGNMIADYQQGNVTEWDAPTGVIVASITLVSPNEGYALAYTETQDTSIQSAIIEQFDGTTWTSHAGPSIGTHAYYILAAIAALPGRVWLSGASADVKHASTIWYGSPGNWQTQQLRGASAASNPLAIQIDPIAPDDVWAVTLQTISVTSNTGFGSGAIWHYQNGQWVNVES